MKSVAFSAVIGAVALTGAVADNPPSTILSFNSSFGSDMVLQRAPAKACVVGTVSNGAAVTVTVTSDDGGST